jgi:small-conductance mechanosensitive channel
MINISSEYIILAVVFISITFVAIKVKKYYDSIFVNSIAYFLFSIVMFVLFDEISPLHYFSIFLLVDSTLKIPIYAIDKTNKKVWLSTFMLLIATISIIISDIYDKDYEQYAKIAVSLALMIYLYIILEVLKDKNRLLKVLNKYRVYLMFLFASLLSIWIIGKIVLSIKLILPIVLLLIIILVTININYDKLYLLIYLQDKYDEAEKKSIINHIKKATFFTLIYSYVIIGELFFGFDKIEKYISKIKLINSNLFALDLFSLISSIFLFIILYSYLFLLTKRARITYGFSNIDSIKSIEALIINIGVLVIIIISIIQLGVTWKVFVPIATTLGIGFGIGLQTILNNYSSGFIILSSQKVRIGDVIEIPLNALRGVGNNSSTVVGTIQSIDIMTTTIKTFDNVEIFVPNSFFLSDKIINYTYTNSLVRFRTSFVVGFDTDIDIVKSIILEAINENENIISEKDNIIILSNSTLDGYEFTVIYWIDFNGAIPSGIIKSQFFESLYFKFKNSNIPYPNQKIEIINRT